MVAANTLRFDMLSRLVTSAKQSLQKFQALMELCLLQ